MFNITEELLTKIEEYLKINPVIIQASEDRVTLSAPCWGCGNTCKGICRDQCKSWTK